MIQFKPWKSSKHPNEDVLCEVFREGTVSHEPLQITEERPLVCLDDFRRGRVVAIARSFDNAPGYPVDSHIGGQTARSGAAALACKRFAGAMRLRGRLAPSAMRRQDQHTKTELVQELTGTKAVPRLQDVASVGWPGMTRPVRIMLRVSPGSSRTAVLGRYSMVGR